MVRSLFTNKGGHLRQASAFVFLSAVILVGLTSLSYAGIEAHQPDWAARLKNVEDVSSQGQVNLDHVWTMIAATLVFFMQAGFLLLEAGFVRSKNSINVAQKNIADFILATVLFGAVGFMLMFGKSVGGWGFIGFDAELFAFDKVQDWTFTFFVFQLVFCGTAATIVSGAVAERMKFDGYLIIAVVVAVIIYPVFGHWAWGNLLHTDNTAFLADQGFIDFAGSTVVHSLGAWVALASIIVIGPRIGRFDKDGKPVSIVGHSPVLATMGCLVLWIGWIGFNGGSTTAGTPQFSHIIANTVVAGAMGGLLGMFIGRYLDGHYRPDRAINGVLAGLVGITAGCDAVTLWSAVMIGLGAAAVAIVATELMERKFKLDDAIGAIPVHGFAGAWGTLTVALFAEPEKLSAASRMSQFLVQAEGVVLCFVWGFGLSYLVLKTIDKMGTGLRVSREDEEYGLNYAEHATTLGTGHVVLGMQRAMSGSTFQPIVSHGGDEASELAHHFNELMGRNHSLIRGIAETSHEMVQAASELSGIACDMSAQSGQTTQRAQHMCDTTVHMRDAVADMTSSAQAMEHQTINIAQAAQAASKLAEDTAANVESVMMGITTIANSTRETNNHIADAVEKSQQGLNKAEQLQSAAENIKNVLKLIADIAEQTNLLALNATIEAARSGDAGKGFTVVANEVKNLAQQTARAVEDIEQRVLAIGAGADDVASAMHGIDDVIEGLNAAAQAVAEATETQSQAAQQINTQMSMITQETHSVSEDIQGISAGATQVSARCDEATEKVGQTKDTAEQFLQAAGNSSMRAQKLQGAANRIIDVAGRLDTLVSSLTGEDRDEPQLVAAQ